jgi:BirA family biotin operon repressor/biotin-[acetyl-CoA-carboxylase] ligase
MKSMLCDSPSFDLGRIRRESFVRIVEHHFELPSTNDRSLELARERELNTPVLVLAERQTAGRGRGANRWWSNRGALTFSLVLDAEAHGLSAAHWPRVALTAAVAVHEVVQPLVPRAVCGVRWPNDVYLSGRKLCGILTEPARQSNRLVLGIGANVNNSLADAPAEVREIGTSLRDVTGTSHDLTDFLIRLLRRLANNLDALANDDHRLAQSWSQLCLLRGRAIELDVGAECVRGRCQGIDADGALLLATPRGPQRFFAGIVRAVAAQEQI